MVVSLREEKKLWKRGILNVAGTDEAGRGAVAGPVVAAVVLVRTGTEVFLKGIKDSKKLSSKKRDYFYKILTTHNDIFWAVSAVSEKIIDKINILQATKLAIEISLAKLERKLKKHSLKIDFLLLDGFLKIDRNLSQKSIVKADEKVFSCAAASIIAKVTRDRIMERYHKIYPQYGFREHKGYLTKKHFCNLKKLGPLKIHRRTFFPICDFV